MAVAAFLPPHRPVLQGGTKGQVWKLKRGYGRFPASTQAGFARWHRSFAKGSGVGRKVAAATFLPTQKQFAKRRQALRY